MARLEDLVVNLRGDVSSLQTAMATAQKEIASFAGQTNQKLAEVEQSTKGLGSSFMMLGDLIGTYFGVQTIASIGKAAIAAEALQYRMQAAVGTFGDAGQAMQFIADLSQRLGLNFKDTATSFSGFAAAALRAGMSMEDVQGIFTGTSEAIRALKLSGDQANSVFMALEQMASKGTVNMQDLRQQLGNALPGAVEIFAKAMGVTTQQFNIMVQKGQVSIDALKKLGQTFHTEFGDQAVQAANSAQAAMNRFQNAIFTMQSQLGEGTGALDAFKDALNGLTKFMESDFVTGGNAAISVVSVLRVAILGLRAAWEVAIDGIGTIFALFVNKVEETANDVIDVFNKLKEASNDLFGTSYEMTEKLQTVDPSTIIGEGWDVAAGNLQKMNDQYTIAIENAKKLGQVTVGGGSGTTNPTVSGAGSTGGKKDTTTLADGSVIVWDDVGKAGKNATDTITKGLEKANQQLGSMIGQQLSSVRSFDDLKKVGLNALSSIAQSILKDLSPAISNIFGGGKGGGGIGGLFSGLLSSASSGIGSFFSGLFGGRAAGGSMSPNVPYVVGERGPEVVVPRVGGQVMNRNQLQSGGGQATQITQHISIGVGVNAAARQELTKMIPQIRKATIAGVEDSRLRGASV